MKYMLLIYGNAAERPNFTPEERQAAMQRWMAFQTEVQAAGVLVSHESLNPVTDATTVRVRDGKRLIADGPFAETHEQLGGYFVLECDDLDEAIAWAEKMPGAQYGSVEIRPVMTFKRD
jgi:hypothetical protein